MSAEALRSVAALLAALLGAPIALGGPTSADAQGASALRPAIMAAKDLPGVPAPPRVVEDLGAVLSRATRQFEAKDLTGVLAHVSDDYRTGPMTKAAIRTQLLTMFQLYQNVRARVRIDEVRLVGEQAWIYSTGEILGVLPFLGRWMTVLWWERELEIARREDGAWRLLGYQQ